MAATDATPIPIKNQAYRHYFCIRKNDGTLITSWTGADSERSLDGATFADCTNEATEIGTTGCGYIELTATEMNTSATVLKVTVTNTDALPYVVTFFPTEDGDIPVDATQVGGQTASATAGVDFDDIATLESVLSAGIAAESNGETLIEQLKNLRALIESQRKRHTVQGNIYFVSPTNGDTHANGNRGGWADPYSTIQDCHDNAVTDSNHDLIILVSDASGGVTTLTEDVTLSKRYLQIRGPGRDFILQASTNTDTVTISADGIGLEGFRVKTTGVGSGKGIAASGADFVGLRELWLEDTQGDAIRLTNCSNGVIEGCNLQNAGQSGSGNGISIIAGAGQTASYNRILHNFIENTSGDAIRVNSTGGGTVTSTSIIGNRVFGSSGNAVQIVDSGTQDTVVADNRWAGNAADFVNASTTATYTNNEDIIDFIYLDTVNGSDGDPGIPSQPVQTIARAKTLAADLSKRIFVISGSSFTLASSFDGYEFSGHGYTVALGGQSISGTRFENATISGTGTGATRPTFFKCSVGTATLPPSIFEQCNFTATLTAGSAGTWTFDYCQSGVAGTSSPTIAMAGTDNNSLNVTNWARGLTVTGLATNDVCTLHGDFNTLTVSGSTGTPEVNISGMYGTISVDVVSTTTNAFKKTNIGLILQDTEDMQPKIGTLADLGSGATIADNLADMAGATFSNSTDTLESIYNAVDGLSTASAPNLLLTTTVASVTSQTQFVLTSGPSTDDVFTNLTYAVIEDAADSTLRTAIAVSDWDGSSKLLTLKRAADWTVASGDSIKIMANPPVGSINATVTSWATSGVTISSNS